MTLKNIILTKKVSECICIIIHAKLNVSLRYKYMWWNHKEKEYNGKHERMVLSEETENGVGSRIAYRLPKYD